MNHFFPRFRRRLMNAIYPVLNAFGSEWITEVMRPHIDKTWESMKETGDETGLLDLINMFWWLKRRKEILWRIDQLLE